MATKNIVHSVQGTDDERCSKGPAITAGNITANTTKPTNNRSIEDTVALLGGHE